METKKHIIIDNGSGTLKAGFVGDDKPLKIPAVVGRPKDGTEV